MALAWQIIPVASEINGEWQYLLVNPDSSQTFKATIQQIIDIAVSNGAGLIYPSTQGIDVNGFNLVKQGSETANPFIQAATWNGGGVQVLNAVVNTNLFYYIPLGAGTYNLFVGGIKNNSSGIWAVYLDGVLITSIDWYNSTVVNNSSVNQTFTVTADGWYGLSVVCAGKNAASSANNLNLSALAIQKK